MNEQMKQAIEFGTKALAQAVRDKLPIPGGKTLQPFIVFHDLSEKDGQPYLEPTHSIMCQHEDHADKQVIRTLQEVALTQRLCDATFFFSEAWVANPPASESREQSMATRVSERPDRQECLIVNITTREGCALVKMNMQRDEAGNFAGITDPEVIYPEHSEGALVPNIQQEA